MLPGISGFHWTFGHVFFVSIFILVVVAIAATVALSLWRAHRRVKTVGGDRLLWQADFKELPVSERCCRHELAGRTQHRTCPNAFECGHCPDYEKLAAVPAPDIQAEYGLSYPVNRMYHRGHTWVEQQEDGTVTVGLDDIGYRLVGRPDRVELPGTGTRLTANGPAWRMRKAGVEVRVLSPIDGQVVETGSPEDGWYLRVKPAPKPHAFRHLLSGPEVSGWVRRELERLQALFAAPGAAPSLADGGVLMHDLVSRQPEVNWDEVVGAVFLEP